MPPIKRDAVLASIRNQLMNEPQKNTILVLNLVKLFADRKDDGEFVKELAELASDLANATVDSPYMQPLPPPPSLPTDSTNPYTQPSYQPVPPMPYIQSNEVPSFADYNPVPAPNLSNMSKQDSPAFQKQPPEVAGDVVSALGELGEDTTAFQHNNTQSAEPILEGYTEWVPKPKKNKKNPQK